MLWSAFILGLFGSFHCVGMCAPIALAIRGKNRQPFFLFTDKLLYNLGRITTYAFLGNIAGILGQSLVWIVGYQVYISALLGVGFILMGVFSSNPDQIINKVPFFKSFVKTIQNTMALKLQGASWDTHFFLGVLSGFLPCGLVYAALAAALTTSTALEGMAYMALFGLGTLPLMLLVSVAGQLISVQWRNRIRKIYPFLFILIGFVMIWRAYAIGIAPEVTLDAGSQPALFCH
ncbi:sulfite exporter TauE/SafE family protein [Sediminitomix flava]|uniref:Urease accessory protein UreH-like transmembrane domain-containing protein n=1 Tax=Sediminitomix flava TaxID=379075 RepID=A0A315Z9X1_SEDFL|nr:sulfite exporter TauE/SafE family protein [Sediminitomix flava]PWJ41004.1 hypothetical protein BC781_104270 [Sediminitomix flava]